MKLFLPALCIVLGLTCSVQAQQAAKAPEIIYHAHSFFEIRSSKGTVIITDPHLIDGYGRPEKIDADVALLSHSHNDHTQISVLADPKKTKIIPGFKGVGLRADWNEVDTKVKDVKIRTVGVYHDNAQGMKYGKNTIFVIEVDGWKIAHLGDLGHLLTKKQLKQLGPLDVVMIPVGGIYTLNGTEAKKVVAQIKPKEYIIPMHYGTSGFDEVLSADEFLEDQPRRNVAKIDDNRLILNRDPDRPRPLIVQMDWRPKGKQRN